MLTQTPRPTSSQSRETVEWKMGLWEERGKMEVEDGEYDGREEIRGVEKEGEKDERWGIRAEEKKRTKEGIYGMRGGEGERRRKMEADHDRTRRGGERRVGVKGVRGRGGRNGG